MEIPSATIFFSRGKRPTNFFRTGLALFRSWRSAEWTTAATTIPNVSTTQ